MLKLKSIQIARFIPLIFYCSAKMLYYIESANADIFDNPWIDEYPALMTH